MRYKAFTLVEIIVVVSIVTLLGSLLIPISISQITYSKAESYANILASSIYSQQQNAFNGYEDLEYGVVIENNKIIMYGGPSYEQRENSKEIITQGVQLSTNIGGGNVIHFEKNSLKPSHSGTITSTFGEKSIVVQLNSEGVVSVQR